MTNMLVPILIVLSIIENIYGSNLGKCVQENACVCRFDEYSIVNISNIIENQKPPYLEDTDSNTNYTYYFSGCKNTSLGNLTFSVCFQHKHNNSIVYYYILVNSKRTQCNQWKIFFHNSWGR